MTDKRTFRWLHLSDLHVGMSQQGWLWPNVKSAFLDDLAVLLKKTGPVDLVIFSGDLTQQATPQEFGRLNEVLHEISEKLGQLGSPAPFLPVPGNHDVSRTKRPTASGMLLKRWCEDAEARKSFWEDGSELKRFVHQAFRPYSKWLEDCPQVEALGGFSSGVIPGDLSVSLKVRDLDVGLIGLNSAWLQLDAGEYEKKLHVDIRQMMGVTANDPPAWRQMHDIALLVTHHPVSWLRPESLEDWKSEIDPPGRFDAHLFGHMHVADAQSLSHAGSDRKTALQAASIFGLEYFGEDKIERIHGYSVGEIEISPQGKIRRIWPRILQRHQSGARRFIPDYNFELEEDNRFVETYSTAETRSQPGTNISRVPVEVSPVSAAEAEDLESIQYKLIGSASHARVRLLEQDLGISALHARRCMWLQAEWGLGSDGFLASILQRLDHTNAPVFRFDFSGFKDRESFFDEIKRTLDCTFEKLCELISKQGPSYILFDNVEPLVEITAGVTVETEIDRIGSIVLDYCPDASVLIRSRAAPSEAQAPIKLRPLDEADIATYVSHATLGGRPLSQPESAAKLHRITDGAPSRLDAALKSLQVVSLADLISHNSDFGVPGPALAGTAVTLVKAIHELRDSDDPFIKRSFDLLKTLTIFPQGEQLERIRRFDNSFPFHAPYASHLHERGLIDAVPLSEVAPSNHDSEIRILRVSRAVRDFIRSELDAEKMRRMDERALEVYFGKDWKSGDLSSPIGHKFDDPLQSGYKIGNASALLIRLFSRAVADDDEEEIKTSFRVISAYFAALGRGNHFRSIAALADDLGIQLDIASHAREAALIKMQHAKSLRMIGQSERARDVLEKIDLNLLDRDLRQSAMLNLALCYDTLRDPRAREVANEVIQLGKTEAAAFQAKSILIKADNKGQARFIKLKELEEQAKRKKYKSLQNTIALMRSEDPSLKEDELNLLLHGVLTSSRENKDFYNGVRAIVKVGKVRTDRGEILTDLQKSRLIDAYHFLFNERLSSLFDSCHEALWSDFERTEDGENLLRLFRHSSLIWRLRDLDGPERTYAKRLAGKVRPNGRIASMLPRETAYFFSRVATALAESSKGRTRKTLPRTK